MRTIDLVIPVQSREGRADCASGQAPDSGSAFDRCLHDENPAETDQEGPQQGRGPGHVVPEKPVQQARKQDRTVDEWTDKTGHSAKYGN